MKRLLPLLLAGCGAGSDRTPTTGAPPGRVLEGPLVGSALAVVGDGLWISAPGAAGDGFVARLDRPSGDTSLAEAAVTVAADGPQGLSGAFAWCPSWDGRPALAVGSPDLGDAGRAWLVPDPPPGRTTLDAQPYLEHRQDGAHTGAGLACGDLDGDGLAELAVSAPDVEGAAPSTGEVLLLDDDAGSLATVASVDTTWGDARLGFRSGLLAGVDLDGDGGGDLVAAGAGSDRVHLLPGPLAGSYLTNGYGTTLQGEDHDESGYALATGDVDGDGTTDLVAGAPGAEHEKGGAWVVFGPISPDRAGLLRDEAEAGDAVFVRGVSQGARAGAAVAVPGDVDGDGRDDLLVGAPLAPGVGEEAGAAYLLLGSHLDVASLDEADALLLGDVAYGRLGWAVAGGDLDGDGAVELYVSAPEADLDGVVGAGEVWVFPPDLRGTHYPSDRVGRVTD